MKTIFWFIFILMCLGDIIILNAETELVDETCHQLLYYKQTVRCECPKDNHLVVQIYENKFLIICPSLARDYVTLFPYLRAGEIVQFWTIPVIAQSQGIQGMEVQYKGLGPYLKPSALASK